MSFEDGDDTMDALVSKMLFRDMVEVTLEIDASVARTLDDGQLVRVLGEAAKDQLRDILDVFDAE